MPFVFEGGNMSLKLRNKISLRLLSQQQLVNYVNKVPLPNTFCNLNFQFKHPDSFVIRKLTAAFCTRLQALL